MATTLVRRHADIQLPAGEAILAGQIVKSAVVSGVDTAQVGTLGATTVLGVAVTDADDDDTSAGTSLNTSPLPKNVSIGGHGEYVVTYGAAATIGQRLKAAAAGAVRPWVSGTDAADLIIGYCTQSTGNGATGRAYIGT